MKRLPPQWSTIWPSRHSTGQDYLLGPVLADRAFLRYPLDHSGPAAFHASHLEAGYGVAQKRPHLPRFTPCQTGCGVAQRWAPSSTLHTLSDRMWSGSKMVPSQSEPFLANSRPRLLLGPFSRGSGRLTALRVGTFTRGSGRQFFHSAQTPKFRR